MGPDPQRAACARKKGGCADWIEDLVIDGEYLGRSRGGLTSKIHLAVDAAGLPLAVILTPGQPAAAAAAGRDSGPRRGRAESAGRAGAGRQGLHPPHSTRTALRERRINATIPERADQVARRNARGSAGGRPPAFDPDLYKLRNVVERCFNWLKQFRGLATRFAKRAAYHRAEIILACIVLHLR
nr:transposase [Amycolatopsis pittospori]